MRVCQQLRTTNDTNGNPRRLWVVWDIPSTWPYGSYNFGQAVEVIDEGYSGKPKDLTWRFPELPAFDITPSEYRNWLKVGKELAKGKQQ